MFLTSRIGKQLVSKIVDNLFIQKSTWLTNFKFTLIYQLFVIRKVLYRIYTLIFLDDFHNGLYFIGLTTNTKNYFRKVIIQ